MPLTPAGFFYPPGTSTDSIKSLLTQAANAAELVMGNHEAYTWRWASQTEQDATTAAGLMRIGDLGLRTDTGITYKWSGSLWVAWLSDWINYTATLTGITLGTGQTFLTKHRYVWGEEEVEYFTRVTSGGNFSTPTFSTPSTMNLTHATTYPTAYLPFDGDGSYYANSGAIYRGGVLQTAASSTSSVLLGYQQANSTTTRWDILGGSVPQTLTAGAIVRGWFRYQPA